MVIIRKSSEAEMLHTPRECIAKVDHESINRWEAEAKKSGLAFD